MKRSGVMLAAIVAGGLCMSAGAQSMSNQGMSDQGMSGQGMSSQGMGNKATTSTTTTKKHTKSMHMKGSQEMMGTVMSMDKKTGMVTMKMKNKSAMSGMKEGETMMMKGGSSH